MPGGRAATNQALARAGLSSKGKAQKGKPYDPFSEMEVNDRYNREMVKSHLDTPKSERKYLKSKADATRVSRKR